ncbi:hypothetical protein K438DRAFT_1988835 [Mycena galopus ATCC 62051]|nr:hypothetical protein K438DRAFT_1988835 [Mycena galopus ATCC 62051]
MSETRGPRLPAEVVDQVLQNFDHHKDRSTLCKCWLVSRTWLASSRGILFSSVAVNRSIPYNDGQLKVYQGATIRPYLRGIRVGTDPTADWTINQLPNFLAQFPELSTLWLTDPMVLLVAYARVAQLERLCNEHRPRLSIVRTWNNNFDLKCFGSTSVLIPIGVQDFSRMRGRRRKDEQRRD